MVAVEKISLDFGVMAIINDWSRARENLYDNRPQTYLHVLREILFANQ
jgi:hypothetical protein